MKRIDPISCPAPLQPGGDCARLGLLAIVLLGAACTRITSPPAIDGRDFSRSSGGKGADRDPGLLGLPPIPELDLSLIEGDEFVPVGATVILPDEKIDFPRYVTPKMSCPTTDECISPDKTAVAASRSEGLESEFRHWLLVYKRGDKWARSVFHTYNSFDVLWSKAGGHLSITSYLGKNTSEVFVYDLNGTDIARPIDVKNAIKPYFSEWQMKSPVFVKAYRWSDGPYLIVRGIGRSDEPPHDLFGYEVLINADHPDDANKMHFIRGYVKYRFQK